MTKIQKNEENKILSSLLFLYNQTFYI